MTYLAARRLSAAGMAALALGGCANMRHMGASPCRDTTVTVYFQEGADSVPDIGRQVIAATAHRLKSCPVTELRLLGLADAAGTPADNLDLSKRRAESVLNAFVQEGLPIPHYTLVAAGERGSVAPGAEVLSVRTLPMAAPTAPEEGEED